MKPQKAADIGSLARGISPDAYDRYAAAAEGATCAS